MKKILLTIAMLGVALASTASAHPHGCFPHHSACWFYPTYCYTDYDDCDYAFPAHHHKRVIVVP
jgi:hypothetical protein